MQQGCIRQPKVAFRVFEINRVDFVRHGRRTNFPLDRFLLEVANGNVAPDITAEIDKDRV